MTTSNPLKQFLTTGQQPTTAREKSALLDQCRNQLLSTNNQNEPMTSQLTKEFIQWKRTNPSGTAAQFTAWKTTGPKKPSATINAFATGIDPANLPRLSTGKLDSLAISNSLARAKAAELAAASAAVSARRAPNRTVINKSKYSQP